MLAEAGVGAKVATITARAMNGEIGFEGALRERVRLLEGMDTSKLETVFDNQITYTPGAKTLVATMRANGAYTALVSGGFTAFTGRVAAELGFDEHRANTLMIADGKLTGNAQEPILGREAKIATLDRILDERGLTPDCRELRLATVPTIWGCCSAQALAWRFMQNPQCRRIATFE